MTILIAPDKFKGSCSAQEVCDAVAEALLSINPGINFIKLPMADGGDGTCVVLTRAAGGTLQPCTARDPLLRTINTQYGLTPDGKTAIGEMAAASGLARLQLSEYNPLITSSAGTGDIILKAVTQHQVTSLILGIGGTATNDGGIGMAAALGVRFYDKQNQLLEPLAQNLITIHRIDLSDVPHAIRHLQCTLLCDVNNPLFGPDGASAVFGPQKGATQEMISVLDDGLRHLHAVIQEQFNKSVNFPGAGAAGGFPAMLTLLMQTQIRSGTEFITDFTDLENHIRKADLVITGEGRIDAQTLSGKLVSGIAALAARYAKPLVIVAGASTLTAGQTEALHIHRLVTLVDDETPYQKALTDPVSLIRKRIIQHIGPLVEIGLTK